jgi:glycosyltransferase involved in cell wall biosynthesis
MATGNPILAFDYPTIKEVISDNENGYLCKADDIDDMVIRLQKIKDDVNKLSVAKRAKKDAYDLYTWNKRVTQILNRLNV